MTDMSFKRELSGSIDEILQKVTSALSLEGFGILTRIDFDKKIKEKLNKNIKQIIILGVCNPQLAYEAFLLNPDVTSLLPCNAVIREIENGKISVEFAKPSEIMKVLGDQKLIKLSQNADTILKKVIENLN